jgi:hypothetical protein
MTGLTVFADDQSPLDSDTLELVIHSIKGGSGEQSATCSRDGLSSHFSGVKFV